MYKDQWLNMWASSKAVELELLDVMKKADRQGPHAVSERKESARYSLKEIKAIKNLIQSEIGRME